TYAPTQRLVHIVPPCPSSHPRPLATRPFDSPDPTERPPQGGRESLKVPEGRESPRSPRGREVVGFREEKDWRRRR
ncbi:hypothetical protein LZ31DRAFT_508555, partial [Colletotrichum somersetense]